MLPNCDQLSLAKIPGVKLSHVLCRDALHGVASNAHDVPVRHPCW